MLMNTAEGVGRRLIEKGVRALERSPIGTVAAGSPLLDQRVTCAPTRTHAIRLWSSGAISNSEGSVGPGTKSRTGAVPNAVPSVFHRTSPSLALVDTKNAVGPAATRL